jgi:hypothetical protein
MYYGADDFGQVFTTTKINFALDGGVAQRASHPLEE